MKESPPGGAQPFLRSPSPARPPTDARASPRRRGPESPRVSSPSPAADPYRQERRIPLRILKMLTAHSHLLHPEYLQPLTSAPVSIELDAKKSPLALLAQTCSQIGKPDPPSSSKLASLSSGSLGDKDSSSGRSSKSGEAHQPPDDKSSFKPYAKLTGECRKDAGLSKGPSDKTGFRVPSGGAANGVNASCPSFAARTRSPCSSSSPPLHSQSLPHRQRQTPSPPQPPAHAHNHAQAPHTDGRTGPSEQAPSDRSSDSGSSGAGAGGAGKKDSDLSKSSMDVAQLANSSHVRASANSSNASSACSPRPDSKPDPQASQPGPGAGHIAPVSPFKPGHSVFPMPPSSMGYHGSIVGAYAGYPSHFMSGVDHAKSGLGLGLQRKTAGSSPLSGASPPSLMQGLCRDPYCLAYPNAAHLGGSGCSTCVHDPSASHLKQGFPGLVYPSHHLHSLHPSALSPSPALSHPLFSYGYMLSSEPQTHACNWVSAGGPCDKRFSTSEELLAHLRSHTAMHGLVEGKLHAAYPSSMSAASCHLHLPPPGSPGAPPGAFSLRGSPGLGLAARYHPYAKGPGPGLPMHSLPSSPAAAAAAAAYYSPYALYSQRLGAASALGYQ